MKREIQEKLEEAFAGLPLVQYAWISAGEIPFSEKVRSICSRECPRYGTSWACPPGVGTVEECRRQCSVFKEAFVFTTIAEVNDVENMEETLAMRGAHEEITRSVAAILKRYMTHTMALSAESCAICETCAYPDAPCRFPEKMIPCMEGYGILVPTLAERAGIEFVNGSNLVTWFGIVLFTE